MAVPHRDLIYCLRRLARPGSSEATSDSQLIERFAHHRDENAFAALVDRHGPMVLHVARRALADEQDAEDALQATFLVLARRSERLRKPHSLPAYLHGVVLRIARKIRAA